MKINLTSIKNLSFIVVLIFVIVCVFTKEATFAQASNFLMVILPLFWGFNVAQKHVLKDKK